jgi:hypothetical protein
MCTDFTDLNKCCPKDNSPLAIIDQLIDSVAGCDNGPIGLFLRVASDMAPQGGRREDQFHNSVWHILLYENVGGVAQRRPHVL